MSTPLAETLTHLRVGNQKFLVDFYKLRRDVFGRWALGQHQLGAPAAHALLQSALLDFYDQAADGRLTRLPPDVPAHVNRLAEQRLAAQADAAAPLPAAEARRRQLRLADFHRLGAECQRLLTYFYFHGYNFARMSGKLGFANPAVARRQKGACLRRLVELTEPPHDFRAHLDELERFADGELDETAQAAFEHRLGTDDALAAAYAAYEQFAADLRWAAGHDALRYRLRVLDRRLDQRTSALVLAQRRSFRGQQRLRRWSAGAVLALALALALGWWAGRPSAAPAAGWRTYYQPSPGLPVPALGARPLLAEAVAQYRAGHYPAAMHTLGRLSPAEVGRDTLNFYRGVFLLRAGDGQAALAPLRRLAQRPADPLARRALYHLGMAYWQTQQAGPAFEALRQVATDSLNPYRISARRALASGALLPPP